MAPQVETGVLILGDDQASKTFKDVEKAGVDSAKKINVNWKAVGATLIAAGAGLEVMARKIAQTNDAIRKLSVTTNLQTKELRNLAIETSNVTFPMKEVLVLFDLAQKRGAETGEEMKKFATFWDTVGDATGESSEALAKAGGVLRAFGIELGREDKALGAMGFAEKNLTLGTLGLLQVMERSSVEIRELGLGLNETAAVFGILESRGIGGRQAMTEFRQAINESDGDIGKFLTTMKIAPKTFIEYNKKVQDSADIIPRLATEHAKQFTIIQKLTHWFDELAVKHGKLLEAGGLLAPVLIAVGAAIAGIAIAGPAVASAFGAIGAAIGVGLGPITLIIAGIAAAVAVLVVAWTKNWGDIQGKTKEVMASLRETFAPVLEKLGVAFDKIKDAAKEIWDKLKEAFGPTITKLMDSLLGDAEGLGEGLAEGMIKALDAIIAGIDKALPAITSAIEALGPVFEVLMPAIVEGVKTHLSIMWEIFKAAFKIVVGIVKIGIGLVKVQFDAFKAIGKFIGEMIGGIIEIVQGGLPALINFVVSAMGTIKAGVINAIESATAAWGKVNDWWDIVRDAMESIKSSVMSALASVLSFFKDKFIAILMIVEAAQEWVEKIKGIMKDFAAQVFMKIGAVANYFQDKFQGMLDFLKNLKSQFKEAGQALIAALVSGIKSMAEKPKAALESVLKKLGELLPSSDAKTGPLSNLTASGRAIPETLATGINERAVAVDQAMRDTLRRVNANVETYAKQQTKIEEGFAEDRNKTRLQNLETAYAQELALAERNGQARAVIDKKYQDLIANEHAQRVGEAERLELERASRIQLAMATITEARHQEIMTFQQLIGSYQTFFGELGGVLGEFYALSGEKIGAFFELQKGAAIAEATINAYLGMTKALASFPPPVNYAMAAVVFAKAIAGVAAISAQKPPGMAKGGIITRPTEVLAGEAGPEAIIPLDRLESILSGFLGLDKDRIKERINETLFTYNRAIKRAGGKKLFHAMTASFHEAFDVAMQDGGIVTRPTTALLGERGPEAVIPLNRMNMNRAPINVSVNFSGNIWTMEPGQAQNVSRQISRYVKTELARLP